MTVLGPKPMRLRSWLFPIAVRFAAVLLAMASSLSARAFTFPCTCQDIPKVEAELQSVIARGQAWGSVLADILGQSGHAPQNMDQAKDQFHQNMGWTSVKKIGGVDPNTGETIIDPAFEQENCDIIVNGVKVHEHEHLVYNLSQFLPAILGDQRLLAKILAKSEVHAYTAQQDYLEAELEKLKRRCLPWRCKCNNQTYESAPACAKSCPKPSMGCIAPTCIEMDPKTGKPTGKSY